MVCCSANPRLLQRPFAAASHYEFTRLHRAAAVRSKSFIVISNLDPSADVSRSIDRTSSAILPLSCKNPSGARDHERAEPINRHDLSTI
jgi:hypothetical protein